MSDSNQTSHAICVLPVVCLYMFSTADPEWTPGKPRSRANTDSWPYFRSKPSKPTWSLLWRTDLSIRLYVILLSIILFYIILKQSFPGEGAGGTLMISMHAVIKIHMMKIILKFIIIIIEIGLICYLEW